MIVTGPVCMHCEHYRGGLACDAFPDRIPDLILLQGNKHTEPVAGDHGIRYEPQKTARPDRRV
jgi:hypothetical protein